MPQEAEDVAVELIRAASGHDIDDAAGGAAELGHVVADDELELLHRFLRDGGANTVHRVIPGVGAVHRDLVRAGALAAEVDAAGGGRADRRRAVALRLRGREGEIDVVAAVDGQVVDAPLIYRFGHRGAGGLN